MRSISDILKQASELGMSSGQRESQSDAFLEKLASALDEISSNTNGSSDTGTSVKTRPLAFTKLQEKIALRRDVGGPDTEAVKELLRKTIAASTQRVDTAHVNSVLEALEPNSDIDDAQDDDIEFDAMSLLSDNSSDDDVEEDPAATEDSGNPTEITAATKPDIASLIRNRLREGGK